MNTRAILPAGFEDLEPFVEYWAGETNDVRWDRRSRASMAEIRRFYDAMLARAPEALRYLNTFSLGDMPGDATQLFRLVLSLAHVSIAVELHKHPRVLFSPFPHGLNVETGPWPQGN